MHIGRNNPGYEYHLGTTPLKKTPEEKDLGVFITNNLKPSRQATKAAPGANSMVELLKKTMTWLDHDMLLNLLLLVSTTSRLGLNAPKVTQGAWNKSNKEPPK